MREQAGWHEHARYMDELFESGFVLFAGPLEGEREVLWIVEADSQSAIRERMAEDPWQVNGMLRPERIERWTVVLDAMKPKSEARRTGTWSGPGIEQLGQVGGQGQRGIEAGQQPTRLQGANHQP